MISALIKSDDSQLDSDIGTYGPKDTKPNVLHQKPSIGMFIDVYYRTGELGQIRRADKDIK